MKTKTENQLQNLFQKLSFVFLGAMFAYFLLPFFSFTSDLGRQLPFVNNSAVKVSIVWLLCLYIAGDVKKRHGLILIYMIGHVLSITSMLLYIFLTDTSYIMQFPPWSMDVTEFLLFSIGADILVTLPVFILYQRFKKENNTNSEITDNGSHGFISTLTFLLTILFALASIGYHIGAYLPMTQDFFIQLPMVSNSAIKVGFMALICFYVNRNITENIAALNIVIVAHVISIMMQSIYAIWGDTSPVLDLGTMILSTKQILWGAVGLDSVITLILILSYVNYWNKKFDHPKFLRPVEFRALMALSDVIVEGGSEKEPVKPAEIAASVDNYVHKMGARRKWIYRVTLYMMQIIPVVFGKAPFSELDYENKKAYLMGRFYKGIYKINRINFLKNIIRSSIRLVQQISFVGYYSDPRVHPEIGYEFFTNREGYGNLPIPEPKPHPLNVLLPKDVNSNISETDVCIVGSGAGGSILAYEMAKQGRKVLLLEKGKYVKPRDFSEDEVDMIGKLYGDGVFQQTEDFKFTILQGNCVGGTTVVNNAVCFDLPEDVMAKWIDPNGQNAGLDPVELRKSMAHIRDFLPIEKQEGVKLNPGDPFIEKGLKELDPNGEIIESDIVDANIKGCFGCGYCNMGCKYGNKLSMLDTVLPWTQKEFPDKLTILAECAVTKFTTKTGKSKEVERIHAQLSNGQQIEIRANTFILSAGTIASSYIMKKSGLSKNLPVGKNLCFNVGSPVYGVFDETIRAHDGLQIAHYYKPLQLPGVIFESWWNPPVSQAINMPGWFNEHYKNMRNYDKTMALGVLIGSKSTGYIVNALTGGPGVEYAPDKDERKKLASGLKLVGEILFAAGAKKVMYNTWSSHNFTSVEQLDDLDELVVNTDELALGTGHPQGGNAISQDPNKGVVDSDFKVHGYSNLYVCDASVFPTSLGVNPQLTIMALAHYAAKRIK